MGRPRAGTLFQRTGGASAYWYGAFYPANGGKRRILRLMTDKGASRSELDRLIREDERIATGLSDPSVVHRHCEIDPVLNEYLDHCKYLGQAIRHIANKACQLRRLIALTKARTLAQLSVPDIQRELKRLVKDGLSARTHNTHRASLLAFLNYCVTTERLPPHRFGKLPKLDEKRRRVRQRRAFTLDEIGRLLMIARLRPVAEYGRPIEALAPGQCRGRKTWRRGELTIANLARCAARGRETLAKRPAYLAMLEARGREREFLYRVLLLTGLRRSEAATLRWTDIDSASGVIRVSADRGKASRDDEIPIHPEVAEVLRELRPAKVNLSARVFRSVPSIRAFDGDLRAAGIPKRDASSRVVDMHATRMTTCTLLARAGVPPHVAQKIMRHDDVTTTLKFYVDFTRADGAKGIRSLKALPATAA